MKTKLILITLLLCFGLTGCEKKTTQKTNTDYQNTQQESTYDSADTAVIVAVDIEANTISFLNLEKDRQYTLSYSGTTILLDRFQNPIVPSQLQIGDIVDVTFLKDKKSLYTLTISPSAWYYEDVSNYSIDENGASLTIGEDTYKIYKDCIYASQDTIIDFTDVNKKDILTIVGIDRTVYAMMINKGHGYLRLKNEKSFIGGWLEVGTMVVPIRDGMLLTLSEGTYDAYISHDGTNATLPVEIKRNEETELDLGSIELEEKKNGTVILSVYPSNATVYVDTVQTDVSEPLIRPVGIHQIIVRAEGYVSVTKYIKFGSSTTAIDITLESLEDDEDDKDTDKKDEDKKDDTKTDDAKEDDNKDADSATSNTDKTETSETSDSTSNTDSSKDTKKGYKVYFESPEQTEVYVDGTYIGIIPVSIDKKEGEYIITLRASGYQTRSYTIRIDNSEKDETYNFANLLTISQ